MKNTFKKIQAVIAENRIIFMWILLFFLIGIVLGSYTIYYMSEMGKVEIGGYFNNFLEYIQTTEIDYMSVLLNSIKGILPIILLIILFGYTLIGFPFVLLINLFKGYILGFTLALVITVLGTNGLGIIFTTLIIQNIIFVPVIIMISILSMKSSIEKFKSIRKENSRNEISGSEYLLVQSVLTAFILIGIIIETYISPNLVRLVIS
ncbi:MAG: stage II sporulation protein M [Sarcina sp.]